MSAKRKHEDTEPESSQSSEGKFFESAPIEDRKSKFIGLFSPDSGPEQLQAYNAFTSAMHRMVAWRRPSKQKSIASSISNVPVKTIYDVGSDDDGEKYGGKKLEKVLVEMNVTGTVVVARWYGGILLGPVRFEHIANVAKEAINKWKESREPPTKKLKEQPQSEKTLSPEEVQALKRRLAAQLTDRDNSITVLRDLLAQRKGTLDSPKKTNTTPAPTPDYASMPLAKLRVLEKARDSTISWILKQIDEIEASQTKTDQG